MNISRVASTHNNISFQTMKYFHIIKTNPRKVSRHMVPIAWHKPPEGKYKLNIDGSYDPNSTNGGIGGVIHTQNQSKKFPFMQKC